MFRVGTTLWASTTYKTDPHFWLMQDDKRFPLLWCRCTISKHYKKKLCKWFWSFLQMQNIFFVEEEITSCIILNFQICTFLLFWAPFFEIQNNFILKHLLFWNKSRVLKFIVEFLHHETRASKSRGQGKGPRPPVLYPLVMLINLDRKNEWYPRGIQISLHIRSPGRGYSGVKTWNTQSAKKWLNFNFRGGGEGGLLWSQNWKYSKWQEIKKWLNLNFRGGGGHSGGMVLWSQNWKYSKCQEIAKFQWGGGGGVVKSKLKVPKFQFFSGGGGVVSSQNSKCQNFNFSGGGGDSVLPHSRNFEPKFTVQPETCLCITDSLSHTTYAETNKFKISYWYMVVHCVSVDLTL